MLCIKSCQLLAVGSPKVKVGSFFAKLGQRHLERNLAAEKPVLGKPGF